MFGKRNYIVPCFKRLLKVAKCRSDRSAAFFLVEIEAISGLDGGS